MEAKLNKTNQKNEKSGKFEFGENSDNFRSVAAKAQSWSQKYKNIDEIPDSLVPKEYDFRNIEGYDFTGSVRDQAECGSCYTLGFIQAIEARLKLKYAQRGSEIPGISPQFQMECNYMNEGCDGGWGIFNGFFAERASLVSEKCAPYKARTKG